MTEVILHVGLAKTASTSIQNTLSRGRDALHRAGASYAYFSLNGKEITNHSLALNYLFSERCTNHHVHAKLGLDENVERERNLRELEIALEQSERVIISGEEVPFFSKEDLQRLRDFFVARGETLRIVALVRPTISFLASLSQQFVKSGFNAGVPMHQSPAKIIMRLNEVFPDAEFYSFNEAKKNPRGPVGFFLDKIGVDASLGFELTQDNLAWSDNAARLGSYINMLAPIVHNGAINPLRKEGDISPLNRIGGERFNILRSEVNIPVLISEIEWLVKRYGDSFWEDPGSLPAEPVEWQREQIIQAARAMEFIPIHLAPLIYSFFRKEAKLAEGARITPIVDMVNKVYFGNRY